MGTQRKSGPRAGRPRLGVDRSKYKILSIRVTRNDFKKLQKHSKEFRMSVSALGREIIMDYYTTFRKEI